MSTKRSRFVRPETTVLTLSDGATLTVKKRLTHGEQTESFARMYLAGVDGSLRVNPLQSSMALVTAYLVDWTVTDDTGSVVSIAGKSVGEVEAVLNAMGPDDFAEIKSAIEAHERAMSAERAAGKLSDGAPESSATSPSPVDVAGDTSGSAI
jgi:hypothetical protein